MWFSFQTFCVYDKALFFDEQFFGVWGFFHLSGRIHPFFTVACLFLPGCHILRCPPFYFIDYNMSRRVTSTSTQAETHLYGATVSCSFFSPQFLFKFHPCDEKQRL